MTPGDMARALAYAQRIAATGAEDDSTLLSRALLHADAVASLARAYGDAWRAFDAAGKEAEREHDGRRDYDDATRERLNALSHERAAAHVALLRALHVEP